MCCENYSVIVFKSFGREEALLTLPKNVKMQKTRLSQQTEYLNWAIDLENFARDVAILRVEFTIEKREPLFRTLVRNYYTPKKLLATSATYYVNVLNIFS